MSRTARIERQTSESKVLVEVDLDGTGRHDVSTGVGFYDHMLISFARHSLVDLVVQTEGDTHIDAHHTVEDTAIVLGQALREALGDKAGIRRFGDATRAARRGAGAGRRRRLRPPLLRAHRRAGGQQYVTLGAAIYLGSLTRHVFETLAFHAHLALHVRVLAGREPHHIVETQFKAFARAFRDAVALDPRETGVPSTKGHSRRRSGGSFRVACSGCVQRRRRSYLVVASDGRRDVRATCARAQERRALGSSSSTTARGTSAPPYARSSGPGPRSPSPVTDTSPRTPTDCVVPGVGAYAACMAGLRAVDGPRAIGRRLAGGRPVLGICVGMQVLFERGIEHGVETEGCDEWPGLVERLQAPIVPHMGWNTVDVRPRLADVRRRRGGAVLLRALLRRPRPGSSRPTAGPPLRW